MANQNNIEWAMQAELEEELQQQQNHALFSQAAASASAPPPCEEASRTLDESLEEFLKSIEEIDQLQPHEINDNLHPPPPPPNFSITTPASLAAAVAKPPVFFQPESENIQQTPPMVLQREEESLISSMPFSIYQTMVDQVWDEIMTSEQQQQNHQEQEEDHTTNLHIPPPQTQETNGWMSLVEFLIEAGVSVPRELSHPPPPSPPPQTFAPVQSFLTNKSIEIEELDLAISNPEIPSTSLVHLDLSISEYDGGSYTYTNQNQLDINVPIETTLVVVDSDNQDEEMDMGSGIRRRRKRGINEDGASNLSDKMKRRMIKNRETAARSRARKQAYIAELEEKIAEYKAENCRLKQDLAEIKKKVQKAQVGDKRSSGKVGKLLRCSSS